MRASSIVYPVIGVRYIYRKVHLCNGFFPHTNELVFEILEEKGPISHWPNKGLVFLKTHSSVAN